MYFSLNSNLIVSDLKHTPNAKAVILENFFATAQTHLSSGITLRKYQKREKWT